MEKRERTEIAQRFAKAGMKDDNAENFAEAIMMQTSDENSSMKSIARPGSQSNSMEALTESLDMLDYSMQDQEEEDLDSEIEFDGLEGTYNLSSTYFDIFDNLMRKYLGDLNLKDELRIELARELGKQSIFLYQRLNQLEQKAAKQFNDK
jgi:hypothetical protein